jgi:hypothetical protein
VIEGKLMRHASDSHERPRRFNFDERIALSPSDMARIDDYLNEKGVR